MPTLAQPRLNRSFILRYDRAHETAVEETDELNNLNDGFDAQIDEILAKHGFDPARCDKDSFELSKPSLEVSSDLANLKPSESRGLGNDHMDVNGIGGVGRAQPLGGVRPAQDIETPATSALSPQDEVQISSAAQAMDELSRTADVRMERISQIQQEIADGIYDSDEKLDAALDRFLDAYGLSDD